MNKASIFFSRHHGLILLVLSVLLAVISIFVEPSAVNTEDEASHSSRAVQRRLEKMDERAGELLHAPLSVVWPELPALPDDMVLYRYDADTLTCWYNVFPVHPLSAVSEKPEFVCLGSTWYILKSVSSGNTTVVEGLLVKGDEVDGVADGIDGINGNIHIHNGYDVVPLSEGYGSSVYAQGTRLFNVIVAQGVSSSAPKTASYLLRWLAMLALVTAIVAYLSFHRSVEFCRHSIAAIVAIAVLARILGPRLAEVSLLFSPSIYTHDGLIDSFGTLLIFNATIFLVSFCLYLCRDAYAGRFSAKRRAAYSYMVFLAAAVLFILVNIVLSISSLVANSSITLAVARVEHRPLFSALTFISYAFLFTSVPLLCECGACLLSKMTGKRYALMSYKGILLFALAGGLLMDTVTLTQNFKREESRVSLWCKGLASDRDPGLEKELRQVEDSIALDVELALLALANDSGQVCARRLDAMYFSAMHRKMDVDVSVFDPEDSLYADAVRRLETAGVRIDPASVFHYICDGERRAHYVGVFTYVSRIGNKAGMMVELTPRADDRRIQPFYSFARYFRDKLVDFHGNYAYPTYVDGKIHKLIDGRKNVSIDGYRHFINVLNDDEMIVVSRKRVGVATYFVSYSYLAILLLLIMLAVRDRERGGGKTHFFSSRVRRLMVWSLVITLVTVTGLSVLFVYQRTLANRSNQMADRISTVQMMMGGLCRSAVPGTDCFSTPAFDQAVREIAANTESVINVYSMDGKLRMSSLSDRYGYGFAPTRLDPDAYQEIVFWHQLYFIKEYSTMGKTRTVMYAPVFNRDGVCVAIVSVPYSKRTDNFTRDAVFHSSTMLSLFLIVLIVAMLFATSITNQIFRPLVMMRQKMKGRSAEDLEKIEYEGDDEISDLVAAYNNMISDLQDSTALLAASERDKAWSEMARQVAHEIKNPLTPMKLEIQRLIRLKQKDDPRWVDKFEEVLGVVLEHIDILSQTASQFSDFAKLYSEGPVVIDLDKTLRDQIMLFGESGAAITYLGMDGALTMGPKPQLIRVFVNLLTNAEQAVDGMDNAQIMVSLRKGKEGMWDIVFEDNGPGVPEENLEKIFRPNFTTKSSGTGLGLAISHRVAECCGGTIVCTKSFTLGGACFTVSLPEICR